MVFSFIVTIIFFGIFNVSYTKIKNAYLALQYRRTIKIEEEAKKKAKDEEKEIEQNQDEKNKNEMTNNKNTWKIEIPKINLVATIEEGTTEQTMNKYVGHFESTEKWDGNVGLAAHNRRVPCQLFF